MTKEEKARVSELRSQGLSVKDIAQKTGMPLNTVKSFCYRNPVEQSADRCRQCGNEIRQTPGKHYSRSVKKTDMQERR